MKRARIIKKIPAKGYGCTEVEIEVSYNIGGYNFFNSAFEGRGYYLHVTPVTIHDKGQYSTRTYIGFSGSKMLIKPAKRYSQKVMETILPTQHQLDMLLKSVVERNHIEYDKRDHPVVE